MEIVLRRAVALVSESGVDSSGALDRIAERLHRSDRLDVAMTFHLLQQLAGESAAARYSVASVLGDLAVEHELTVVNLGGKLANDPDSEVRTIAWDSLFQFFDRYADSGAALPYERVAQLILMLPGV